MRNPLARIADLDQRMAAVERRLLDEDGNVKADLPEGTALRLMRASTQLRKEAGMPPLKAGR
jgi:hypothetical protein